ncbi:ComEC/Rec2 family competence protein [candidate division WOR-3 bacterium]|nr:ComEC/Rec2 family competence protein [candidate division WOR-3 bacterium]
MHIRFLYIATIFLAACITWCHMPPRLHTTGRKALYSGIVVSEEHFGSYNRVRMYLNSVDIDGVRLPGCIPVQVYTPGPNIHLGDELCIQGYLRAPLSAAGCPVLVGSIKRVRHVSALTWSIVHRMRTYIGDVFDNMFPGTRRDVATGLVIGGSGYLTPSLKEIFTRAGILHILAVSGLHIGFVCLFGYALFSVTFLPRYAKFIGVMCLIIGYVFITSFRPSVCRAAFMAGLFGIALLLQRNVDRVHITNIAAMILLAIDPLLLFSLSFQLSFAAVYGILHLYPKIQRAFLNRISWKPLRMACMPLAVSFSAQVFVTPLVIHYFHRVSLIAPISNLMIVPIASCIVFMLYAILVLHSVWCSGAHLIALIVRPLLDLIVFIARSIAALPFSMVNVSIPLPLLFCAWGLFIPVMRKYVVFLVSGLLILIGIAGLSRRMIIATSGNNVFVQCPDRRTILYAPDAVDRGLSTRITGIGDRACIDYAITSTKEENASAQWIPAPDPLTVLNIDYGDISITVDTLLHVRYKDQYFRWSSADRANSTDHHIHYIVSNGKRSMYFNGPAHGSIIDDLVTELRLIVVQCLLL